MTPDVAEQQLRLRARVSNAPVEKTTDIHELPARAGAQHRTMSCRKMLARESDSVEPVTAETAGPVSRRMTAVRPVGRETGREATACRRSHSVLLASDMLYIIPRLSYQTRSLIERALDRVS